MSSLRTSRTRLVAAAATVVLAALSLTACGDGTGVNDEGASTANSSSSTTSSGTSSSGTSSSDGSSSGGSSSGGSSSNSSSSNSSSSGTSASGSGADSSSGGGSSDTVTSKTPASSGKAGKTVTCEGSNTKTVAAPLNRPVNHLLLTVTNTGSKTCFLYGYPAVAFGEAQAVPPVIEDSQPQAVVTLKPGESGYASVSLSATDGSGSNGRTVKSLTVHFQGRSGSGSVGRGAHPTLPAKGVYVDDSLKVTYWQQEMNDATDW